MKKSKMTWLQTIKHMRKMLKENRPLPKRLLLSAQSSGTLRMGLGAGRL